MIFLYLCLPALRFLHPMMQLNVRMSPELYQKVKIIAGRHSASLLEFVRDLLKQACNEGEIRQQHDALTDQLQSEKEYLRDQVDRLQQLLALSQKSIQQLTEQKLLESQPKTWWRRVWSKD